MGWTKPYNLIDLLNAQEFTDLKNEGLVNAGTPPNGTTRGFQTMNDENGNLIDTRWYDHVYRTGFSHNHSISMGGATEKTDYYLSAGYTDQKGIFRNNDYSRMTGRFTLNHNVNKWLKVGGMFSYTNSQTTGLNTGSTGAAYNTSGAARLAFGLAPNVSPYNPDGSYNINTTTNSIGQGANLSRLTFTNPVMLLDLNRYESKNDRILSNIYAQVNLAKGLIFKTLYGIDYLNVVNEDYRNALHGDGTQFLGATQNVLQQPRRWNWQNTLNYDVVFGEQHHFTALIGAEQQMSKTNNWGADRRLQVDAYVDEYQGGYGTIAPAGNALSENFLQSYFGRLNYDFDKRYLLSFNFRRDGYSAFAQKWGNFMGASAGWALSEEEFWKTSALVNTMNNFKIRGSYGMVGNFAGIGDFAFRNLYTSGLYGFSPTIFFDQAGNPNLTWETSKKLDVGFEAGFFNNRLNVEFVYYKNDISNLILNEPQAPSRGIPDNSIAFNVGSMYNKGFEVTLGGTIVSKNDFSWSSSINLTTVKNEVTSLANNNADVPIATGGLESPSIIRVGESIGSFYAVRTKGVNPENGQRIFVLADGTEVQYDHSAPAASRWTNVADGSVAARSPNQISDGVIMGPALPKCFGGFDNTIRWKGIDLNMLLYFSGGNYVYNGSKAGLHDNRNWNNASDALNRWQNPGDNAEWPRVVFGDNISNGSGFIISNNVEKGNFIKIRNIALGYTLPKQIVEKASLSSVRIYLAALNLFTFTKYTGFDPEIQNNNGATVEDQVVNAAPSVDRNSAPLARTLNFGINVGF